MGVSLVKIKKCELRTAWRMQQKGFIDVYFKYFDKTNPVLNSYIKFVRYFERLDMYWIIADEIYVGQIWISAKENQALLARIFVLKKYRNNGFAQNAIAYAESMYPQCRIWHLDTIVQEKRNCHLYEKLGYKPCGVERRMNKRMSIIDYEKNVGESNGK